MQGSPGSPFTPVVGRAETVGWPQMSLALTSPARGVSEEQCSTMGGIVVTTNSAVEIGIPSLLVSPRTWAGLSF